MIVYLILPYVMGMVFVKMEVMKEIVPKIVLEKVWIHTLNMMEQLTAKDKKVVPVILVKIFVSGTDVWSLKDF